MTKSLKVQFLPRHILEDTNNVVVTPAKIEPTLGEYMVSMATIYMKNYFLTDERTVCQINN